MTDYSKMSDLEINIMVSKSLYGELSNWHKGELNEGVVDYCNNPSDAWPILKEYCIDINWDGDSDSKPLRDAMIVYLMMKESDNADI